MSYVTATSIYLKTVWGEVFWNTSAAGDRSFENRTSASSISRHPRSAPSPYLVPRPELGPQLRSRFRTFQARPKDLPATRW
jgi:hypothetical protein